MTADGLGGRPPNTGLATDKRQTAKPSVSMQAEDHQTMNNDQQASYYVGGRPPGDVIV